MQQPCVGALGSPTTDRKPWSLTNDRLASITARAASTQSRRSVLEGWEGRLDGSQFWHVLPLVGRKEGERSPESLVHDSELLLHFSRFPLRVWWIRTARTSALTQSVCSAPSLLDDLRLSTHSESPFTPPIPTGLSLSRRYDVPAPHRHLRSWSARAASGRLMKLMAELSRVVPAEQRNFIQYDSGDFMLQATRPNAASSAH